MPQKVRVFWWRVLHEFLAAPKEVLYQRHVKPMAFCDLSGADREKIKHVLTECTVAKLFCREIKLLMCTKLPSLHPHSSASDVLITGMYSLWTQRNKCRHREN